MVRLRAKLLAVFLILVAVFAVARAGSILLWRERTTARVSSVDLQGYRSSWSAGVNGPWITYSYSAGGKEFTATALTVSRFKTGLIALDYCRWNPGWSSPSGEEWFDFLGAACLLLGAFLVYPSPLRARLS